MKPGEIVNLNEGLGDIIARTGVMGQSAKLSAEQKSRQEKVYKIGLKNFQNQLAQSIKTAASSGMINPPGKTSTDTTTPSQSDTGTVSPPPGEETVSNVPAGKRLVIPAKGSVNYYKTGSQWYTVNGQKINDPKQTEFLDNQADSGGAREENIPSAGLASVKNKPTNKKNAVRESYEWFDSLVESKILAESEDLSQYIKDYVLNQARELVQKPAYINKTTELANEIQKKYEQTGKLPGPDEYRRLWDLLWSWYTQVGKQSGSSQSGTTNTFSTDANTQRNEFQKNLINGLKSIDFNDGSNDTVEKLQTISKSLSDYLKQMTATK